MSDSTKKASSKGSAATIAIVLVTSLFFVWGLTMNLVNALNSPMSNYLELSSTEASLLQVAYYGAYFVMAIPASIVAKKYGYKGGVIMGLALFVLGSLITVPATNAASYALFLIAMFVIAAGATTLETNCNPYITKLGDEEHESMRLNLAQSFNGVGNIVGPLILAQFLGTTVAAGEDGFAEAKLSFLSSMRGMYIVIAVVLAIVLAVFVFVKLPTPPGDEEEAASGSEEKVTLGDMLKRPYFALGVLAEFIFIGLQVAGQSLFSSFALQQWDGMTAGTAATLLSVLSLFFTIGRFVSTPIMAKVDAGKLLGGYMIASAVLFFVAFLGLGAVSVVALIIAYLFVSIGYPVVFSLTLTGFRGSAVKTGSAALTMSIVGAALIPLVMSAIADAAGINVALLVAVPGFLYVAWYGLFGCKLGLERK